MRTLDRYVVKNFLTAVLLCFVALMAIRVVSDLFFNMDEFTKVTGDEHKSVVSVLSDIGTYYLYQSLLYLRELGGVIIVAAAAFTLARMNHTNELTAILASGVSLHRVLLPIVIAAIGLNVLVLFDSETLIPRFKNQIVRDRDDLEGKKVFEIWLVTDNHRSVWYSREFTPGRGRLKSPLLILRDDRKAYLGHVAAPSGAYDGRVGLWVFSPAAAGDGEPARPVRLHLSGTPVVPTSDFIHTLVGPKEMLAHAQQQPRNRDVEWHKVTGLRGVDVTDASLKLRIRARRLALKYVDGRLVGTELEQPSFTYAGADGRPLVRFRAARAVYHDDEQDPRECGWELTNGRLIYACNLDPERLSLRQESNWMQLMSSSELGRLLQMGRVTDRENAKLVRHTRLADFFGNVILLLVGLPFILSRERNIKASAGLTVLIVGAVYLGIYLSRYLGMAPMLAAWVPIIVFGTVSAFVVEMIKT